MSLEPKKLMCRYHNCSKSFANKTLRQAHQLRHIKNKEFVYQCMHCSDTFNVLKQYQEHLKNSHSNQIYQPYVCKFQNCKKQFKLKRQLFKHLEFHEKENSIYENLTFANWKEKKFDCPHCVSFFHSSEDLIAHVKFFHKKQRPLKYFCSVCEKGFTSNRSKNSHQKTHLIPCLECDAKFENQLSFNLHFEWHAIQKKMRLERETNEQLEKQKLEQIERDKHSMFFQGYNYALKTWIPSMHAQHTQF